jgi:hypothetical protein
MPPSSDMNLRRFTDHLVGARGQRLLRARRERPGDRGWSSRIRGQ